MYDVSQKGKGKVFPFRREVFSWEMMKFRQLWRCRFRSIGFVCGLLVSIKSIEHNIDIFILLWTLETLYIYDWLFIYVCIEGGNRWALIVSKMQRKSGETIATILRSDIWVKLFLGRWWKPKYVCSPHRPATSCFSRRANQPFPTTK